MAQTTKTFFKGIYQIEIFLSVFIPQDTNRRISSIINESPKTFLLMQRFEVTFINKYMFFQHSYSSDLSLHINMYTPLLNFLIIKAVPQGSIYISDTGVTLITFLTHEVFSITDIFISFTLLGGNCLYNSSLLMYFIIIGE